MDPITDAKIEEAIELLKAGKKEAARAILIPLAQEDPNIPDTWYLLGFALTERDQKQYCFQQVLRIDPSNKAAQNQLAKLLNKPAVPAQPQPEQPEQTEQQPTESEAPAKNEELSSLLPWIAATAMLIIFFGGIALYAFNGIKTNNQVNALFTQRQCAEVLQYKSFDGPYPGSLFSSVFSVYQQVEECQTQVTLADAIQAQDWANAYSLTENYFAQYPQGAFTEEVRQQAANILMGWASHLVKQNDYPGAIQKLETIQNKFPATSASATVMQTMLDDYLLWGRHALAQNDYESAEKSLKFVAWHAKASLKQVKQANDDLTQVYLAWGKAQATSGQYAQSIIYYESAKALNPTLMDYDQLETPIFLAQVAELTQANDFDQALKIIKSVLEKPISNQNKTNALAAQGKTLSAYAQSSDTQAQAQMSTMAANLCQGQLPTLPIFGTNADAIRFTVEPAGLMQLPANLLASTPAQLHNVLCIKQTYVTIESCEYQQGYIAQRNTYVWDVALYSITTGKTDHTSQFTGATPRRCQPVEPFTGDSKTSDIFGDPPAAQEIIDWLTALNTAK